jgi:hypothetical protein
LARNWCQISLFCITVANKELTPVLPLRKAIEHRAIDKLLRVLAIDRVIKGWEGQPLPEHTPPPEETPKAGNQLNSPT